MITKHLSLLYRAMHSAVMPQYVVCLSGWLSVCLSDVHICFSRRLEYFENNFAAEELKVPVHKDPNIVDSVQRQPPVE